MFFACFGSISIVGRASIEATGIVVYKSRSWTLFKLKLTLAVASVLLSMFEVYVQVRIKIAEYRRWMLNSSPSIVLAVRERIEAKTLGAQSKDRMLIDISQED